MKGVPLLREDGTVRRVPKYGGWSVVLKPTQTDEWDINEVIVELLQDLPTEKTVWQQVASLGSLRVSLGLSLEGGNQEFVLEPELMRFLGERQVLVYFDIYHENEAEP